MKKAIYLLPVSIMILLFSACSSYKDIPYFQNLKRPGPIKEKINNFAPLIIQPEDILSISVNSLNPGAWQDSTGKTEYLVGSDGTVQLPLINEVAVAGLTTAAVQNQLKVRLAKYLRSPSVNVRITNFKVSVLGDVNHPDVFRIPNTRVTLLEALSLAGDLNITAMRTNVLLIREIDGEREYQTIDLTSANVFTSNSYYLKNNDVVYVQPDKTKFATVDRGYRTLTIILSALSIVAIIVANVLR